MKFCLVFLLFLSFSTLADDHKEVYLGGGRYTCQGSNCDSFNNYQDARNRDREYRERVDREYRQQNDAIIQELKTMNENQYDSNRK